MGNKKRIHNYGGDYANGFSELDAHAANAAENIPDYGFVRPVEQNGGEEPVAMYGMPYGGCCSDASGMGGYTDPGYAEYPHSMGHMGYMPGVSPYGYPPINIPPVKPMPLDPFADQFSLPVALKLGTLFRWLYDPYCDPYRERC